MKIIDCSKHIEANMSVYPGDPQTVIEFTYDQTDPSLQVGSLSMSLHSGTHIDAPRHYIPFGKSIDDLPIQRFFGSAVVFHLGDKTMVLNHELEHFLSIIQPNDCILLIHSKQARIIFEKGISDIMQKYHLHLLGVSSPTVMDEFHQERMIHEELLTKDICIIENIVSLEQLPPRVQFFAIPLKIKNGDASMVRAFAIFPDSND